MPKVKVLCGALALIVSVFVSPSLADSQLDWIKAQPEDDLGLDDPDRAKSPASTDRVDLVNFKMTGKVKQIDDGDTIDLVGAGGARFVIRFSDMDTPEVAHPAYNDPKCPCNSMPYRPGQPGGQRASESLKELIAVGDNVSVECYEPDNYGRFACHVFKEGMNVNLEQIKRGWGWIPSKSLWVRDPKSVKAEQHAKSLKLGAWGLQAQVSPEEWRKKCWREEHCDNAEK